MAGSRGERGSRGICLPFIVSPRAPPVKSPVLVRAERSPGNPRPGPPPLRQERVSLEELTAAVRAQGMPGVAAAHAIILETDGSLAVIPRQEELHAYDALEHVEGVPRRTAGGA